MYNINAITVPFDAVLVSNGVVAQHWLGGTASFGAP